METFHEDLIEFRKQIEKGTIPKAYKELMEYIMDLKNYFKNKYTDYFVSGIYYGYMDMTYFSFSPALFKNVKLKIAIVFVYDKFRFEVWLAGYNKQVQLKYWNLFRESGWNKYQIVQSTKDVDSIIECVLVDNPDFSNLNTLTNMIEKNTLEFVKDINEFLLKH